MLPVVRFTLAGGDLWGGLGSGVACLIGGNGANTCILDGCRLPIGAADGAYGWCC